MAIKFVKHEVRPCTFIAMSNVVQKGFVTVLDPSGIVLNGRNIRTVGIAIPLSNGDKLTIGERSFIFEYPPSQVIFHN